jgi:hypothetical protein
MTLAEIQQYLVNEQTIAKDPTTPEWQVFTTLLSLVKRCQSVEKFITQAQALPFDGPAEEVKEAKAWLKIALDTIQGS